MKITDSIYRVFRPLLTFLAKVFAGLKTENKEVLEEGPILIVANHRTMLDPIFLMATSKRTIHFFAKIELLQGWKKLIFNKTAIIPVDRKAHNPESLTIASELLKNGKLVGIFPEGTRNYSENKLLELKPGAARIAIENDAKVVVAIQTGRIRLFGRSLKLVYSKPFKLTGKTVDEGLSIIKKKMEALITDR